MRISYFKRYKMEIDLDVLPPPELPAGFAWVGWSRDLLETHAEVLYESFYQGIDTLVFSSLGDRLGCQVLMTEISRKGGFVPQATWLLTGPSGPCGTVQGLSERGGVGAIQNLGIAPAWRGQGLGSCPAPSGSAWLSPGRSVSGLLEVTAQNDPAIRLYRRSVFAAARRSTRRCPNRATAISFV